MDDEEPITSYPFEPFCSLAGEVRDVQKAESNKKKKETYSELWSRIPEYLRIQCIAAERCRSKSYCKSVPILGRYVCLSVQYLGRPPTKAGGMELGMTDRRMAK